MTKKQKSLGWVVAIALVVALVGTSCGAPKPPKEKELKIGAGLCITGALASSLEPAAEGSLDYLKYVNEELGGIEYRTPEGKTERIRMDIIGWGDHAYSMPKSISTYKRLGLRGPHALIWEGSTPAEAIAKFASRDKLPTFGFWCAASPINIGSKPNYYTPSVMNMAELNALPVKWFLTTWTKPRKPRVAFIMTDVPSLRPGGDPKGIPVWAKEAGFEFLGFEWLSPTITDATIELSRIKHKDPDLVVTAETIGLNIVIAKSTMRLGFDKKKVTFVHVATGFDESLVRLAPDAMEGTYGMVATALPNEDLPGVNLARKVRLKYHDEEPTLMYLHGFVCSMMFVHGLKSPLEKVGYENLTGPIINESFHHITGFDSGGIVPPVTIEDSEYPVSNPWYKIVFVENGEIKPVSDWLETPPLIRHLFK